MASPHQKRGLKTGNGLAGSTDPFLNHIPPNTGGKTLRLDHTETPQEQHNYACPFCANTVQSSTYTGLVNHRTVCGHRFKVVNGEVVRKHNHVCPRCGTVVISCKSTGRVQSKHRTPKGQQCPQTAWVVKS